MKLIEKLKMDLICDSRDKYKEAILSLLEKDEAAFVVDLGCGDSKRLTYKVLNTINTQVQALGIDLDPKDDTDKIRYTKRDLNEPLPLFRLPEHDQLVDVIITSQVIEHLHNTDNLVKEIHRLLRPGGYAIISTPNLASWHNALALLAGKQPGVAKVSDDMFPEDEVPGHCRVFTATELIKLLQFHGFYVEKIVGTSYFPLPDPLASWLAKRDWRHAGNITIKVRKPNAFKAFAEVASRMAEELFR